MRVNNKSGKKKRIRPIGAPRPPLSPYMEFVQSERATVLSDLGNIGFREMGKELGRRWKMLSPLSKSVFIEKNQANRKEYEKKMEEFNPVEYVAVTPSTSSSSSSVIDSAGDGLKKEDLGFAKEGGFPWHPARREGSFCNGSRIIVIFFGTGQRVTVNEKCWLEYSDAVLSKIMRSKSVKTTAFDLALKELTDIRHQLNNKELLSFRLFVIKITFFPLHRF